MTLWHLRSRRKTTGGRLRVSRKKRKTERGIEFLETKVGKTKQRLAKQRGGKPKVKLSAADKASVSDPKTGKTKVAKIISVKENEANPHYVRRNIITLGAVIETDAGLAKVRSRPGQDGLVNAVLLEAKKK